MSFQAEIPTRAVTGTHIPKKVKNDVPKTKGVALLNVKGIPGLLISL